MMAGYIPYRDVWDHKPPLVYLIDFCAMKIGDGTINSVRFAERIFAVTGAALMFLIVLAAFGKSYVAFLTAFFFLLHMYHPDVFEGGNLTEEYGAVFLIAGITAAFATRRFDLRLKSPMAFISGLLFSLAALSKEPFALAALPWFVYVAWPQRDKYKDAVVSAGLFIIGSVLPVIIIAGWLLVNDALLDWIKTTIHSLQHASRKTGPLQWFEPLAAILTLIAAGLGIVSLFNLNFLKKHHYLPVAALAGVFTGFLAACLSGRRYGHYYMMLIPSYVLLGACGMAFIFESIGKIKKVWVKVLFLLLLSISWFLIDAVNLNLFLNLLAKPAKRWEGNDLTEFILDHTKPTDKIWTPSFPHTHLYVDTGRLSPTKWFIFIEGFPMDSAYGTKQEKMDLLRKQLSNDPPRIVVINNVGMAILEKYDLTKWLKANYELFLASEETAARASQIWIYAK
jgi:hypothetical protein